MVERARRLAKLLCALLALALGVPALAAPAPAAIAMRAPSCCCGTGACCAPSSACCKKDDAGRPVSSEARNAASAPGPRIGTERSTPLSAPEAPGARPARARRPAASPAEERLHLRQGVFRT